LGGNRVDPGRADIAYPQLYEFYAPPYSGHFATIPEENHTGFL
jgi:hypothetical protein